MSSTRPEESKRHSVSFRFFEEFKGQKINKKKSDAQYSTIIAADKEKYTLLAGKKRESSPATFLGSGGYGRVKKALDEKGNMLAVKIFKFESWVETSIQKEFFFLTRFGKHPKLVICERKAYLFQPFVKGQSLAVRGLTSGYLPDLVKKITTFDDVEREQLKLNFVKTLLSVMDAVESLHRQGVLHRDLHGENILYDEEPNLAALIDFGRAMLISEFKPEDESSKTLPEAIDYDFTLPLQVCDISIVSDDPAINEFFAKIKILGNLRTYQIEGKLGSVLGGVTVAEYARNLLNSIMLKQEEEIKPTPRAQM